MNRCKLPFLLATLLFAASGCSSSGLADFSLTVFHTNDRHSHFLGLPNGDYQPAEGDGTVGGAARWMGLVKQARQEGGDVLLVDAGDFTMGTMLVAAEQSAADLNFMKEMGYAAAALGNHEFDWGEQRLARMIQAASQPPIPLLASNIHFNPDSSVDDQLEALYGQPGEAGKSLFPWVVVETPGGVRVGLMGLVGNAAAAVSNVKAAFFSRDIDELAGRAQEIADLLRQQEHVDLVLALSHLGLVLDNGQPLGESIELARLTHGIDAVISGHTHIRTETAFAIDSDVEAGWRTLVSEAGCYGLYLGMMQVTRSGGEVSISGETIPIDDQLAADEQVQQRVQQLADDVEENLLSQYPLVPAAGAFLTGAFDQVLTHSAADLARRENENGNLGYLVADAMRRASGAQMAFASNGGDLRASLPRTGNNALALQDAFIATPLGTGPDGKLGYPLARYYLQLIELQLLMEATICDRGLYDNDFMINVSGIRVVIDTSRAGTYSCVQRITTYQNIDESDPGTVIYDRTQGGFLIDKTTLFQVCTSSYIADQMSQFNVYPKDAGGQKISLEQALVTDDSGEVKLWYSVAGQLAAGDPLADMYSDDEQENPLGPYWRRVWDVHTHPCNDHPYCR
ncbi:MAG: hypothetical protein DRI34_07125 [Deltaproteobacteria bacterium]|nr:MAG: hypothetical protein DRI34_07125 [Deltaproteobacteria bacterium]